MIYRNSKVYNLAEAWYIIQKQQGVTIGKENKYIVNKMDEIITLLIGEL